LKKEYNFIKNFLGDLINRIQVLPVGGKIIKPRYHKIMLINGYVKKLREYEKPKKRNKNPII